MENILGISICQTLFFQKINYSADGCRPYPTGMVLGFPYRYSSSQGYIYVQRPSTHNMVVSHEARN
jgi:hypothetical protein